MNTRKAKRHRNCDTKNRQQRTTTKPVSKKNTHNLIAIMVLNALLYMFEDVRIKSLNKLTLPADSLKIASMFSSERTNSHD